jgi:hypothetical protein
VEVVELTERCEQEQLLELLAGPLVTRSARLLQRGPTGLRRRQIPLDLGKDRLGPIDHGA